MLKEARLILVLVFAFALGGCAVVLSRSLVGEPPSQPDVDLEAAKLFNGVWKVEASSNKSHDVLHVHYLGQGKLHIAQLTWGLSSKKDYRREDHEAVLTKCGTPEEDLWQRKGSMRLSTEGEPAIVSWQPSYDINTGIINLPGDGGAFAFAYYVLAGEAPILMIWTPDVALFKEAVKEGKLIGTVEESKYEVKVTVDESTAILCTFIKAHRTTNAFYVGSPFVTVYRRIVAEEVRDQEYTSSQQEKAKQPDSDHKPQ